jgi:lipopolysaccharide transport system ATP-binding protein
MPMHDIALEFNHIWKKFKRGEKYDSLRDLIPAMTKRLFSGNLRGELQEKEFWALRDVSFEVKRGEALGIIGPNGAGKSTILKLLSGILRPNKGDMRVNGRLSALIEVGAGFHPDLTGRENIYLNGSILGMKKKEIYDKFEGIVSFSELEEFIDTPVKRYSSGMYARLGFSVAAHMEPDILLVDEVLSVGDSSFQARCIEKIRSLRASGVTIIFISHNMEAVLDLCTRTILLFKGSVIAVGSTEDIIKQYRKGSWQNLAIEHEDRDRKSNPIKIKSVSFLDHEGHEKLAFRTGDKIVIRIFLAANERISRPVLGVALYNTRGFCVYGHNSKVDRYELGDIYGRNEVEIEYEKMELQSGTYLLTVGIFDSLGINAYELKDRYYNFSINGEEGETGVIHIPHKWRSRSLGKDDS